ncbi:hypothetical protein T09_5649 [Trichinella sp. T9]|nr:hypothetical protein T09_5649 [Trichinella sp. T9]
MNHIRLITQIHYCTSVSLKIESSYIGGFIHSLQLPLVLFCFETIGGKNAILGAVWMKMNSPMNATQIIMRMSIPESDSIFEYCSNVLRPEIFAYKLLLFHPRVSLLASQNAPLKYFSHLHIPIMIFLYIVLLIHLKWTLNFYIHRYVQLKIFLTNGAVHSSIFRIALADCGLSYDRQNMYKIRQMMHKRGILIT